MKKILFIVMLFITATISAQVGIGTTAPQEQLHIAGTTSTIRVEGLNSTNNANNNGTDVAPLGVDSNGNLVIKPTASLIEEATFLNTVTTISSATGAFTENLVHSSNFTTTAANTIVTVHAMTGVNIQRHNGQSITDGAPRLYGMYILLDGVEIVYSAGSFTATTNSGTVLSGYFTVNGSGAISVPAGNHTLEVRCYISGGSYSTSGEFGYGGSRLTILQQAQ